MSRVQVAASSQLEPDSSSLLRVYSIMLEVVGLGRRRAQDRAAPVGRHPSNVHSELVETIRAST